MSIIRQAEYQLGDMRVEYPLDTSTRMIGLTIIPANKTGQVVPRRAVLTEGPEYEHLPGQWSMGAYAVDALLQVKWIGAQPTSGFGQGRSMGVARLLHHYGSTVRRQRARAM